MSRNPLRLCSKKELKTLYGIPYCPAHIARLEAAGVFPLRVRLGQCRVAWVADEVEGWLQQKVEARKRRDEGQDD